MPVCIRNGGDCDCCMECKKAPVNLYKVIDENYEYCMFVFAESRNQAKQFCVGRHDDSETYISFRCKTLEKDVNPDYFATVVDCPNDKAYEYVKALGFEYQYQDE